MTIPEQWWATRRFAIAAILLSALPLLSPGIPPLTDLPGHIARYRIIVDTDADMLSRWYTFAWRPIGNLGVDLLVAALGPLLGVEPAAKLVTVATPMLAVAGMLWISREAHGRVQPFALLALPLAYNYAFHFGFVNYTLAMAFALIALALWMRLGRTGHVGLRATLFVPLSCLVWLCHLFGWAILGLLVFGIQVDRRRAQGLTWPRAALWAGIDCLPLALPAVAFLAWRPGGVDRAGDYWTTLAMKPGWLVMILRDRWKVFDVASVTVVAMAIYAGYRSRHFTRARGLSIGAALLLIAFVAMPFMNAYADMRIAPYLAIVALLAIAPSAATSPRRRAALALAGLAFFGLRTVGTTLSLWQEGRVWDRELAILDHLPRGSRVAALVELDCKPPWAPRRLNHLPSMAVVRRASFTNNQFELGPDALVTLTPATRGSFVADPSQLVHTAPCPGERTMADALAELPRDRFDHLWLLPRGRRLPSLPAGLVPVARAGDSRLYRIAQP